MTGVNVTKHFFYFIAAPSKQTRACVRVKGCTNALAYFVRASYTKESIKTNQNLGNPISQLKRDLKKKQHKRLIL